MEVTWSYVRVCCWLSSRFKRGETTLRGDRDENTMMPRPLRTDTVLASDCRAQFGRALAREWDVAFV